MIHTTEICNEELIEKAKSVKPRKIKHGFTVSDVGCALITDRGNVYLGVSIDTTSDMDTEVIIKKNKSVKLEDLLPFAWDAET